MVADFIMVASKLIFLKSKYLLPGLALTDEEEADIKDLEDRLKMYQELNRRSASWRNCGGKAIVLTVGPIYGAWRWARRAGQSVLSRRERYRRGARGSLNRIFDDIKTYELETETIKEKIVTLEEKIIEVLARIEREGNIEISSRSKDVPRADIILLFLAVLHLARTEQVALRQDSIFSDIMVRKEMTYCRNPEKNLAALEALLFIHGEPITYKKAAAVLGVEQRGG